MWIALGILAFVVLGGMVALGAVLWDKKTGKWGFYER